jgi:hypothetical protein
MLRVDPALLTQVECTWIEKQHEQWLRFGRIHHEHIVDRRTRIMMFRPGALFAWIEWTSNGHGTIASSIIIAQAVAAGEPYTTHPHIRPGAEILLHIETWPKVEQALQAIDAVENAGIDPCDASPDHWRHVGNRIAAGMPFRSYTQERHKAWLRRKALAI